MGLKIPKVMIAAVKSGSGKTTVTCAFLKQLLCRKKHPVSFKCGPDYIDPMFHEQVLKIPSKNLDTFFSDALQIQTLYEMELPGHDIAVLEGVMGLYDGLGGGIFLPSGQDAGCPGYSGRGCAWHGKICDPTHCRILTV